MKNNFKKSNKAKSIIVGIALVLSFVMIIGLCLQVFGQGKAKPSEWFKHDTEQSSPETPKDNASVEVKESESSGISVYSAAIPVAAYDEYGIDMQAEKAYSLSVTYTPADTTFKQTTFSAAFKNPNSTWAKGKSVEDYVEVKQPSVGSTTATLTVKKGFSEQIIVSAVNTRHKDIKATVTVDYVCDDYSIAISSSGCAVGDDIGVVYGNWSNGTLTPDMSSSTIEFKYDVGEGFVNAAKAAGFTVNRYYTTNLSIGDDIPAISTIYKSYIININSLDSTKKTAYNQFLGKQFGGFNDYDACGMYTFTVKRVYNGVTYDSWTPSDGWSDYDRGTNWGEEFEVAPTSISVNNSSIVHG